MSSGAEGYTVRRLGVDDVAAYQAIRSEMLVESPASFGASPDDDKFRDPEFVRGVLSHLENGVFGGFDDQGRCVSVAGLVRSETAKRGHVASVYGVFTRPSARGHGLARRVMAALLDHARGLAGLEQVQLSVSSEASAAQALYRRLGFQEWGREPHALRIGDQRPTEIHLWIPL